MQMTGPESHRCLSGNRLPLPPTAVAWQPVLWWERHTKSQGGWVERADAFCGHSAFCTLSRTIPEARSEVFLGPGGGVRTHPPMGAFGGLILWAKKIRCFTPKNRGKSCRSELPHLTARCPNGAWCPKKCHTPEDPKLRSNNVRAPCT